MPTQPIQFQGFPRDTFLFLADLSAHNPKAWFDANKDRFRRFVEQPVQEFVTVMCARLSHTFKDIEHLEGKVFRIHRDIRFSKDKTPYKTHIGIRFNEDISKNCAAPLFYVQMESEKLLFATGQKEFEGDTLDRYRAAVMDAETGRALARIIHDDFYCNRRSTRCEQRATGAPAATRLAAPEGRPTGRARRSPPRHTVASMPRGLAAPHARLAWHLRGFVTNSRE